jgi:hypothetical protein
MPDLEFACTECGRLLGKMRADAPDAEREEFRRSLESQGFTPVHHFGWFCSRACGEAFFKRQAEAYKAQPTDGGKEPST